MENNHDNKKPLLDIENELLEMSKNLKIIISLKNDIDELILKEPKEINDNILIIEDKYEKIKKQIQSFLNKKKFIYNFISNEKIVNSNNYDIKEENEENENLLNENNKMQNAKEAINKMQNKIKIQIDNLDKNLLSINFFEKQKKQKLIKEIDFNDIKENIDIDNINNNDKINQKIQFNSSILNIKAKIYNEEKNELEKTNNIIEQIKQGTKEMKIITRSHNDMILNLREEHNNIKTNIDKGILELNKNKDNNQNKNNKLIICMCFLIFIVIVMGFAIYYKIWKRK